MAPSSWFVSALLLYGGVGVAFAIAFVAYGIGRVDAAAANAPLGVRMLLFPGSAVLWPLLALKWRQVGQFQRKDPS